MTAGGRFGDIGARVVSGVALAVIALGAALAGGWVFQLFLAVAVALMFWELARLCAPGADPLVARIIAGAALVAFLSAAVFPVLPLVAAALVPIALGAFRMKEARVRFFLYALLIVAGYWTFLKLRLEFGLGAFLWLVCLTIAADTAAYFTGRLVGGAKLAPAISPGKTWSGAMGGWAGALVVGLVAMVLLGWPAAILMASVVAGVAGQAGDLAESALKRVAGVKDSSQLIPGHGGFLDRFDAMLGGAAGLLLWALVFGWPFGAV